MAKLYEYPASPVLVGHFSSACAGYFNVCNRSGLILATFVLAFFFTSNPQSAWANDYYVSSTLLDDCQESINIWEGREGDHHAGAMCLGFINGVLTSQSLYRTNDAGCRPEKIPPGAVAYALNFYIKKNPDRIGDIASVLLEDVVDTMYPCPRKMQSN